MSLKIINKTPERVKMTQEGVTYTFDYGTIPFDSDSKIFIELLDEQGSIKNLAVKPTCGCTVASLEKQGNSHIAEIVYDTMRKGGFVKQLVVTYKEGLVGKKIIFNIKGYVQ